MCAVVIVIVTVHVTVPGAWDTNVKYVQTNDTTHKSIPMVGNGDRPKVYRLVDETSWAV